VTHARRLLEAAGAPVEVGDAVEAAAVNAHLAGRALGVVADGGGVAGIEHDPDLPRFELARWEELPSVAAMIDWRQRRPPARETVNLVEEFRQRLGRGDRAIEGAAATLAALDAGQMAVLLVHDDPCDDRRAPADEGRTGRLVDVAVREALRTSAAVRVVPAAGAPAEGIGGLLRRAA
jgi:hypothetical protein